MVLVNCSSHSTQTEKKTYKHIDVMCQCRWHTPNNVINIGILWAFACYGFFIVLFISHSFPLPLFPSTSFVSLSLSLFISLLHLLQPFDTVCWLFRYSDENSINLFSTFKWISIGSMSRSLNFCSSIEYSVVASNLQLSASGEHFYDVNK